MSASPPLLPPRPPDHDSATVTAARLALRCLDLTALADLPPAGADDDAATALSMATLAARADTPHGAPAALCVWPRFVGAARRALDARGLGAVRVATVVNFPHGAAAASVVADEIAAALADGADEIDAVLPWRALRDGPGEGDDGNGNGNGDGDGDGDGGKGEATAVAWMRACRDACDRGGRGDRGGPVTLKVILETGELREPALIRRAALIAIDGGADFIKTSTGKVAVNATPAAVAAMLQAIAERGAGRVGLKVAGGVATMADVLGYVAQVRAAFGEAALTPGRLRFGASSLLPVLLAAIDGGPAPSSAGAGY